MVVVRLDAVTGQRKESDLGTKSLRKRLSGIDVLAVASVGYSVDNEENLWITVEYSSGIEEVDA